MKQEKMAIVDTDRGYAYRLQEILTKRETFPFSVSVYTDPELLSEEGKPERFRLLLAGGECYEKLSEVCRSPERLILLSTGEETTAKRSIRKYQSGEEIRKQLMEIYAESAVSGTGARNGGRKTTVIGIFSPVCREIQTSFSLLMGQFLAKKSRVLYLNFEPFSGLSGLLDRSDERDLTDLVYYLEGGRERLIYKLESMVGNVNGLDYISPAFSFIDLGQIRAENWMLLLQTLRETGNYDYIILDLSELVQGLLDVLRSCEMIYTISNREGMALSRMKQYEDLLKHLDYEDIAALTTQCELPAFKKLPGSIEELPYTDLAGYVKRIVEEEICA